MSDRLPISALRVCLVSMMALAAVGCGGDDGSGPVEPPANRPPSAPSIANPSVQVAHLPTEQVTLTGTSTDPDGDTVTFTWTLTTTRGSTLSSNTGTATTWTAGSGGAGIDLVTLSVTDGASAARTVQLSLAVGTGVAGVLPAGALWTLAQSPYIFTDNVTVGAGQTLQIEPGVQVLARRKQSGPNRVNTKLVVAGTLTARGTPLAGQIVLKGGTNTNDEESLHGGIEFLAGSAGELVYVRVERGVPGVWFKGDGTLPLYACRLTRCGVGLQVTDGAAVSLRRTLIDQCSSSGVIVGDGDVVARESSVRDCDGFGVSVNPTVQASTADIDSCNLDGNGSGNLLLRDVCSATLQRTNLYPADGSDSILFQGDAGFLNGVPLDFTGCYWGFLLAADPGDETAVTDEIRIRTFNMGNNRAFDVYPYSGLPITLPDAP